MNDGEFRELIERAHLIQETTASTGWDLYRDYLYSRMRDKQRVLLDGRVVSMEDYREMTGWLAGVQDALDAPAQLAQMVETERQRRADEHNPEEAA